MRFVRGHHNIFVPIYKDIILPSSLNVGVEGHITVELIDRRTKKVKRRLQFKNLITNAGLNGMASTAIALTTSGLTAYAAVGTGTTAPTNSDTTLVSELASNSRVQRDSFNASNDVSYVSGTPDYYEGTLKYNYSESQANGNLTEIGFFSASSGGTMFSRQLFKDELGDPTEVTKTSDDQLRIIYKIRVYPPVDDVILEDQDISGTTVDVTARPVSVGSTKWSAFYTGWDSFAAGGSNNRFYSTALVSRTATSYGTAVGGAPSVSAASYVTDNFYRDITVKQQPSEGNTSIRSYHFCGSPQILFGIGFSSAIAKADTQRFTLNYRCSWGRHT